MGYNVLDLIDKAINIAQKRKEIYQSISTEKSDILSFSILSNVFIKSADKSIQFYEALKKEIGNTELEEIDFEIYDKMSHLANEFQKRVYKAEFKRVWQYLEFSLDLERDIYSLFIDIQGRFIKKSNDVETNTYKILSSIIESKIKYIEALEKVLTGYKSST